MGNDAQREIRAGQILTPRCGEAAGTGHLQAEEAGTGSPIWHVAQGPLHQVHDIGQAVGGLSGQGAKVGAAGGGGGRERAGVVGEGSKTGQDFTGDKSRADEEIVFGDMCAPHAVRS